MTLITSHILNGTDGSHAGGIKVTFNKLGDSKIFETITDDEGRIKEKINSEEIDSFANYELIFEGKAADAGGKGGANMTMNILLSGIEGGGTLMKSSMALSITGKLAQFGSRMIVAVNNKMFDQWAKNFTSLVDQGSEAAEKMADGDAQALDGGSLAWTAVKGLFKG